MTTNSWYIFKSKLGKYEIRRAGSMKPLAVSTTQVEAVRVAREADPAATIFVEREGRAFGTDRWKVANK